LIFLRICS